MHASVSQVRASRPRQVRGFALLLLLPALLCGSWLGRLDLLVHEHGSDGRHVHTLPAGLAHGTAGHQDEGHHGDPAPPLELPDDDHDDAPTAPGVIICLESSGTWHGGSRLSESVLSAASPMPAGPPEPRALAGAVRSAPDAPWPGRSRTRIARLLLASHALLI